MSEIEPRPFEFSVGDREISAKVGALVCVLFRRQQEVDYFAVNISADDEEEPTVLRVFNNVDVARKLAGLILHEDGRGVTADEGPTFYDNYGWYVPVVIKAEPSDNELAMYSGVNARDIDKEWKHLDE